MNIEITDVTRRFGRTQAVAGVSLAAGDAPLERGYSAVLASARTGVAARA
ncbi:MAG TPA: hypothetical protein VHY31_22545 [Streptosporangiaceae bacterium]|jgi:hypothetical protein|nr:hypothetical protein [Streptosporangiaceae bacterium]